MILLEPLYSTESHVALAPDTHEGPYYIPADIVRSDISEDREGVPLYLELRILDVETNRPMNGAMVDIWTCDADGEYSGFTGSVQMGPPERGARGRGGPSGGSGRRGPLRRGGPRGPGNPGGPRRPNPPTDTSRFLRGVQPTDGDGTAKFRTIFPGWYEGRPTHVHIKVHSPSLPRATLHTGQLFFSEEISAQVAKFHPYNTNDRERITNESDEIYQSAGDLALISDVEWINDDTAILARKTLGVNLSTKSLIYHQ